MKKILIVVCFSLFFTGCVNHEKLTYPTGKWIQVNTIDFIPENTKIYEKDGESFNEISK